MLCGGALNLHKIFSKILKFLNRTKKNYAENGKEHKILNLAIVP